MNSNIFIFTIFAMGLVLAYARQAKDSLCPARRPVLCVKSQLIDIYNVSNKINTIARKVEETAFQKIPTHGRSKLFTIHRISEIRLTLSSKHHDAFTYAENNVNQSGFIGLIIEEYQAYAYLYKSIKTLQKLALKTSPPMPKDFKKLLNLIEENLCSYRNIYHVYSEVWLTIDQIDEMTFSQTGKHSVLPQFHYHSYTIIITQLLQEWFLKISGVVANIDRKFFL